MVGGQDCCWRSLPAGRGDLHWKRYWPRLSLPHEDGGRMHMKSEHINVPLGGTRHVSSKKAGGRDSCVDLLV